MTSRDERLQSALPGLLTYARLLTRDEDTAMDLVQDTVVRALERGGSFRGEASLATWLHRVLYHRFVDLIRQRREVPTADEAVRALTESAWRSDEYTVDAAVVVERAAHAQELREALSRLPVSNRAAVVWHDALGYSATEVADLQGVGLAAAKARIRRGRAMLVSLLDAGTAALPRHPGVPLRCWDARSRVGDYLDGDLGPAERQVLERHLHSCPTCPALYAGLVGVRDRLGRLRDPDSVVPPELAHRVRAAMADTERAADRRAGP